jgi:hypothetical protein
VEEVHIRLIDDAEGPHGLAQVVRGGKGLGTGQILGLEQQHDLALMLRSSWLSLRPAAARWGAWASKPCFQALKFLTLWRTSMNPFIGVSPGAAWAVVMCRAQTASIGLSFSDAAKPSIT